MSRVSIPCAMLDEFLNIFRKPRCKFWISGCTNDNPLQTALSGEPDRWIDVWISLRRLDLDTVLPKLITNNLNREIMQFPIRQLNEFITH
jgi:hypothetical protein